MHQLVNQSGYNISITQVLLVDFAHNWQTSLVIVTSHMRHIRMSHIVKCHSNVCDASLGQTVVFIPEVRLFDWGDSFGEFSSWRNALFKIHNYSGNSTQVLRNGGEKIFQFAENICGEELCQKLLVEIAMIGYYQNENEAVQRHNNNPKHHWPSDPFLQDSIQGHAFYS